jgi:hypothetical protein
MPGGIAGAGKRARIRLEVALDRAARALSPSRAPDTQIVICGYPRSGTSLLYNMLATALPGFRRDAFEVCALERIWRRGDWISKRPLDVFLARAIAEDNALRKRLVFVIPLRDLRDVLTSVHPNVPDEYFIGYEKGWRVRLGEAAPSLDAPGIAAIHAEIERLRGDPALESVCLRYEDLVRDPDAVGAELERRLGRRFARPLSAFHRHPGEHPYRYDAAHTRPGAVAAGARERLAASAAGIGRWREPEHRARIRSEFRSHRELFALLRSDGYERDDAWFREYEADEA